MKKIILSILIISFVFACKEEKKPMVENEPKIEAEIKKKEPKNVSIDENLEKTEEIIQVKKDSVIKRIINTDKFDFNNFKGFYVGEFKAVKFKRDKKPSYSNRINISLDSIDNNYMLYGHSVVAGNKRPFKGMYTFNKEDYSIKATVHEPGDDKYDGDFQFECYPIRKNDIVDKMVLVGKWNSNDPNLSVTERKYSLDFKAFEYNKNQELGDKSNNDEWFGTLHNESGGVDYQENDFDEFENPYSEKFSNDIIKFNSSRLKLNYKEIENMSKGDLEIIRNSIYARHGYSFKNRRMRYFFDRYVDWYIPVSTDVRNQLTDLEKENIELLKRYEKHAEKYYDYFGR